MCGRPGPGGTEGSPLPPHPHHLQLGRGLIWTLWVSVYPPGPCGNVWRSALGELGRGRGWPSTADAIAASDSRGSPQPCRGAGADPGPRGGRVCAPLRPIAAAPGPHWSRQAGGPGPAELPSPGPARGWGPPSGSSCRGRGTALQGSRGGGAPDLAAPPRGRGAPAAPAPAQPGAPWKSRHVASRLCIITRFQPHFLAGVGNVRAGGGGASVGVRRSRESTLDPALPPPLGRARPITHIGPTQTGPLPPPARPPPGAAVPALCSRPPRVAGRRAGRGRARAGRGGGEEGRGWCCPRSRPRPAPAPPALPPPPRSCVPSCPVQSLARPGP